MSDHLNDPEEFAAVGAGWPSEALVALSSTLAEATEIGRRALILADTAQHDADALREAVLDALDIWEVAQAGAQGRTQLGKSRVYEQAAKEMAMRLEQLSRPDVSRETSDDDGTVAAAMNLLTVVGCRGTGRSVVSPFAAAVTCPVCGQSVPCDTQPSTGQRVILWHTPESEG